MKESFAILAALLAVAGNVPYAWQTLRGGVRPHPYTWLVGSIVSGIVLFGMLDKGAGMGALPVAVAEGFTILIFLFSLKYGFVQTTRTDRIFLALSLAAIVPWVLTKDPTLSVLCAVGIDLLGLFPTFRKTWHLPKTESFTLYSANIARHILLLASLPIYNLATTLHSIAMLCTNSGMLFVIFRKRHER